MNIILIKLLNKNLLMFSGIMTIILFFILRIFDAPLHTVVAPNGILSFEFARSINTSNQIIQSWDITARINAAFSLGFDFLFLLSYAIFFSTTCYLIAVKYYDKIKIFYAIGLIFTWLLIFAGIFDAIENIALIKLLLGSANTIYPSIAYYFAIIGVGLVYIIFGIIIRLFIKTDKY